MPATFTCSPLASPALAHLGKQETDPGARTTAPPAHLRHCAGLPRIAP